MSLFKTKKLPFIVHYCGTKQECTCKGCTNKNDQDGGGLFPTHTHGLDKLGYPEIFIDPLAFGKYNATIINNVYKSIINNVYKYLSGSSKKDLMQDLLDRKVLEVEINKLDKDFLFMAGKCKDLIICIRIVYSDFEAVKLAYGNKVPIETPFIQLYVLGDDYVLNNEYYYNGVTW